MSFLKSGDSDVAIWLGDPNCQSAHDKVLKFLRVYFSRFMTPADFDDKVKGNLGETICLCVGIWNEYKDCLPFTANAFAPLSRISKPDIDIVWIHFGSTESDDLAILQEVKTTSDPSLQITRLLVADYEKLFGTNPRLTLQTRLGAIKMQIELQHKEPQLCSRIDRLGGQSPSTSPKVRLIPSLVQELSGPDPVPKLLVVKQTICGKGWQPDSVSTWAVRLSDLDSRLRRLSEGKN
jgi:hypothetical protein